MKTVNLFVFALSGLVATNVAVANPDSRDEKRSGGKEQASLQHIGDWPQESQKAAKAMVEKYGQTDETTDSMWIWNDNGQWKRTIVYSDPVDHNFPMPHKDVLEQFIDYEAPVDKYDELAEYDGSVILERTKGEISARCDKEEANFLALNLANDVATGQKRVEEARSEYADAIEKSMQGEEPEYMQGFAFNLPTDAQKIRIRR